MTRISRWSLGLLLYLTLLVQGMRTFDTAENRGYILVGLP